MTRARMLRGVGVTLAVSVPTMAIEETWHGRPMIDVPGHGWLVPAVIVLAAFVGGGAVGAGRGRGAGALLRGAVVGFVADVALVAADILGRVAYYSKDLSWPVAGLWVLGGTVALVASATGAAVRAWARSG